MYKIFDTLTEYNQFTDNGTSLTSGVTYYVKEDGSTHFQTNNIDGEMKKYDMMDEIPEGYIKPTGNISIKENGENIDIAKYATATVNVACSGGNEDLINVIERDITSITIPSGTNTIGQSAFYQCSNLTSVTIPDSVTTIGQSAFHQCFNLTSIELNSVTRIGSYAFKDCRSLTSIELNSVTTIETYAFSNCAGLTSITIGNSVTSIGNSGFSDCRSLKNITILATTPPTIGYSVFNNTNNCPIYVPSESVEAYKTATNWSTYTNRIKAITTE